VPIPLMSEVISRAAQQLAKNVSEALKGPRQREKPGSSGGRMPRRLVAFTGRRDIVEGATLLSGKR
jgi:hypothetical protein